MVLEVGTLRNGFYHSSVYPCRSWKLGKMPSFERLENPDNNLATEIIGSDDRIIGTFAVENRTPVHYTELPKNLIDALVSTEDERFYKHSGIDFRGTIESCP